MSKPSNKEMLQAFRDFQAHWAMLNDLWQNYGSGRFSEKYPFHGSFDEIEIDVTAWIEECARQLQPKTIEDMQETRQFILKETFEHENNIDTGLDDCDFLFVYFNRYYIGFEDDGTFIAVVCGGDIVSDTLLRAEKYLWDRFVKDEF